MENITPQILAMYIGQQVQTPDGIGFLYSTIADGGCVVMFGAMGPNFGEFFVNDQVKPILRPLSDMTEAEAREMYKLMVGVEFDPMPEFLDEGDPELSAIEYFNELDEIYQDVILHCIGKPEIWAYLISCGFDLFNLIPAGLAVDKTKK